MPPLPGRVSLSPRDKQQPPPVGNDSDRNVTQAETREDCLHMLSLLQRRLFIRLAQQDKVAGNLSSERELSEITKLVLAGKELSTIQQVAAELDWTKVDGGARGDALRALFVIHNMRGVVEKMFERDSFREVIADLHNTSSRLLEDFCAPPGHLSLGRLAVGAMVDRVETVEGFHAAEAARQATAMSEELENVRSRLRSAVAEAFRSFTHSLGRKNVDLTLPRFLANALNLHELPDTTAGSERTAGPAKELMNGGDLAEPVARALRVKLAPKKAQRGAGFNVLCGKEEFAAAERDLDGRWGSYRLFECWLKDAVRWQWIDLNCQIEYAARTRSLEVLVAEKEKEVLENLDQKLIQLWAGRDLHQRYQNVLSLRALLEEAATSRVPVFAGENSHNRELASMAAEDAAAQYREFLDSKLAKATLKAAREKKFGEIDSVQLKSVEDVEGLLADLQQLRNSLKKDFTLVEEVRAQQEYEALKKKVHELRKHVESASKATEKQTNSAAKKKDAYEQEHQELLAKIETQQQRQQAADAVILDAADWRSQVEQLELDYKKEKQKTEDLEKLKAKAKAERKQKEAEAAALRKHIAHESKKHAELQAAIQKQQELSLPKSEKTRSGSHVWKLFGSGSRRGSHKTGASLQTDEAESVVASSVGSRGDNNNKNENSNSNVSQRPLQLLHPESAKFIGRVPPPAARSAPTPEPCPIELHPPADRAETDPPRIIASPLMEEEDTSWDLGALDTCLEKAPDNADEEEADVQRDVILGESPLQSDALLDTVAVESPSTPLSSVSRAASELPHLGEYRRVPTGQSVTSAVSDMPKKKHKSMFSRMKKAVGGGGRALGLTKSKSSSKLAKAASQDGRAAQRQGSSSF